MKPNYKQAFFVAPLVIPACTAFYSSSFPPSNRGSFFSSDEIAQMILIFGIPTTYFFVLILGLPVYFLLKENNKLSKFTLFISGSITGLIVSVLIGTEGSRKLKGSVTNENH